MPIFLKINIPDARVILPDFTISINSSKGEWRQKRNNYMNYRSQKLYKAYPHFLGHSVRKFLNFNKFAKSLKASHLKIKLRKISFLLIFWKRNWRDSDNKNVLRRRNENVLTLIENCICRLCWVWKFWRLLRRRKPINVMANKIASSETELASFVYRYTAVDSFRNC